MEELGKQNPASRSWDASHFTAVGDRVRGGASVSKLTVIRYRGGRLPRPRLPGFTDTSNTTALGGAWFSSQRTVDPFRCDLRDAGDLVLEVGVPEAEGQQGNENTKYTLTLKDTILRRRPDGRE